MSIAKNRLQRIGSLDCVYQPGKDGGPLCVFFHGYGASCWDLVPLKGALEIDDATWVFPNGHMEVSLGPGVIGRAWAEVEVEAFNRAMAMGTTRDMSNSRPPGMDKACDASLRLFQALGVEDYSHLIIGGFSQGAMLAVETILSSALPVSSAVILSGTLLDADNWRNKANHRPPVSFFQSHGTQDPILGFGMAQKLEQLLRGSGWQGHLRSFKGGHEIPEGVVSALREFLRNSILD